MAMETGRQRFGLIQHSEGHVDLPGQIIEPRRQLRATIRAELARHTGIDRFGGLDLGCERDVTFAKCRKGRQRRCGHPFAIGAMTICDGLGSLIG